MMLQSAWRCAFASWFEPASMSVGLGGAGAPVAFCDASIVDFPEAGALFFDHAAGTAEKRRTGCGARATGRSSETSGRAAWGRGRAMARNTHGESMVFWGGMCRRDGGGDGNSDPLTTYGLQRKHAEVTQDVISSTGRAGRAYATDVTAAADPRELA